MIGCGTKKGGVLKDQEYCRWHALSSEVLNATRNKITPVDTFASFRTKLCVDLEQVPWRCPLKVLG
jgi:hypothetical protein